MRGIVAGMGPITGDVGPLEYSANDDLDPGLLAARDSLPEWDIYRVGHGYLAVPGGSDVFMAASVASLVVKLSHADDVM